MEERLGENASAGGMIKFIIVIYIIENEPLT